MRNTCWIQTKHVFCTCKWILPVQGAWFSVQGACFSVQKPVQNTYFPGFGGWWNMCISGLTTYLPKTLTSVPDCSFSTLLKVPALDLRVWVWYPVFGDHKNSQWGNWTLKPEVAPNLKRETVGFWELSKKRRRRRNYNGRSRRFHKQFLYSHWMFCCVFPNALLFSNIEHFKSCRTMKPLLQEWRLKTTDLQKEKMEKGNHQRTLFSLEINSLGDGLLPYVNPNIFAKYI